MVFNESVNGHPDSQFLLRNEFSWIRAFSLSLDGRAGVRVSQNPSSPNLSPGETVSQWGKKVVILAKAGIQFLILFKYLKSWMPAFAGMTNYDTVYGGERRHFQCYFFA
jgi:hypothetical protein